MAFTDRYIKLPVEMYNRKIAEMTGDEDATSFPAYGKFLPMEIISYMPSFDNNGTQDDKTVIYQKNGESYLVLMPVAELERKLNDFMTQ